MGTKTKKKIPAKVAVTPVTITPRDRKRIGFDMDFQGSEADYDIFVRGLELLLKAIKADLRKARDEPLDPHLIAELEPVRKAADALQVLVAPGALSDTAQRVLRMHGMRRLEILRHGLGYLQLACTLAIEPRRARLQLQPATGGTVRHLLKERRGKWERALKSYFNRHAPDADDGDRSNFIAIVTKYLK